MKFVLERRGRSDAMTVSLCYFVLHRRFSPYLTAAVLGRVIGRTDNR